MIERRDSDGARRRRKPPLEAVARDGPLPLSFAQQSLWITAQSEAGSIAYNEPFFVRLRGALDAPVLERALGEIVRRHEILRTTFVEERGELAQRVLPHLATPLTVVDLASLPEEERDGAVRQYAHDIFVRRFDLQRGPLLRATLLCFACDDHALLLVMHHIVCDGWSMAVLGDELTRIYAALRSDARADALPAPSVQYADYAAWQRSWVSPELIARQLEYWKRSLANHPVLDLPVDRVRGPVQSYKGAVHRCDIPPKIAADLRARSAEAGVTVHMALLAVLHGLLSRYGGQSDIVIGTPTAGRSHSKLEDLIGCFINLLPLRLCAPQDASFEHLLALVRDVSLAAEANQDAPFELIVNEVSAKRDPSRSALFQVIFEYRKSLPGLHLPGIAAEELDFDLGIAKYDLTLVVVDSPRGMTCTWEFDTALFERATAERIARHFVELLRGVLAFPREPVASLPLLAPDERRRILSEWNATRRDVAPRPDLCERIERHAQRAPDADAVLFENQRLSFGELNARANQIANHLRSLGAGPDTLVAVCFRRGTGMIAGLLGVLKAGAAYVPLDPDGPRERSGYMLADTAAPIVVTEQQAEAALPPHDARTVRIDADAALIGRHPATHPPSVAGPRSLAYCIYTSGSTGAPKGVLVERGAVENLVDDWNARYPARADERFSFWTNVCFDVSVWEWLVALASGASVAIPTEAVRHDPASFLRWAKRVGVTTAYVAPHIARMLPALVADGEELPSRILLGVEPLNEGALSAACRGSSVVNGYGPTEATVYATLYADGPQPLDRTMPIGRPIANTQIYVLDRYCNPVPIGVAGEVHIAGAGLARGYLNQPGLTAENFVPNPFGSPGTRMYKTGDIARMLADGNIQFVGRLDHQVKVRGFRVETGEIEHWLLRDQRIREAAVIARDDGAGGKLLVAYLVARGEPAAPRPAVTADELREAIRRALPEYMVPSAFVWIDGLPLTPNGKLDRNALPAPEAEAVAQGTQTPARGETETALAQLWRDVLPLRALPGRSVSFFDAGGHSLLALKLIEAVRQRFGVRLSLPTIFACQTIEAQAGVLEHIGLSADSLTVPLCVREGAAPLFCVHPVGGLVTEYRVLAEHLGDAFSVYGLQGPELVPGRSLCETLDDLARAHCEAIVAVRPDGPFRLAGWSTGGTIALAVASALEARGCEVRSVSLIDCWPLDAQTASPEGATFEAIAIVLGALLRRSLAEAEIAALHVTLADERVGARDLLDHRNAALAARCFSRWTGTAMTPGPAAHLVERVATTAAHLRLLGRARPPRPAAFVQRIWASDSVRQASPGAREPHGAFDETVEADHAGILAEPSVRQVAAAVMRMTEGEHAVH